VVKSLPLIGAGPVGLVHRQKVRFFSEEKPHCFALSFSAFDPGCVKTPTSNLRVEGTPRDVRLESAMRPIPDISCIAEDAFPGYFQGLAFGRRRWPCGSRTVGHEHGLRETDV